MKNLRCFRVRAARSAISMLLIIGFYALISASTVYGETYSLRATKKPLKNVLDDFSAMTGITFFYDDAWADFPVTVQFKNIELEPALKRILTNLNHAVIFNPDGSITIRIYEIVNRQRNTEIDSGNYPSIAEEVPDQQSDDPRLAEEADDTATDEKPSQAVEEAEETAGEESEPGAETEASSNTEEAPADAAEAP